MKFGICGGREIEIDHVKRWYEVIVKRPSGIENTWFTKQVSRADARAAVILSLEWEEIDAEVISVVERKK